MVAPQKTVLDFLREQKDIELAQFLTWYCVLVMGWDLNDIAELTINYREYEPLVCDFTLKDGARESWVVVKRNGKYSVESTQVMP